VECIAGGAHKKMKPNPVVIFLQSLLVVFSVVKVLDGDRVGGLMLLHNLGGQ